METKQDGQPLAGGLGSVTPLVRELCAAVADLGGTLLGWPLLEMVLACLISWPMAWPHATYARLHRSGWCWSE